MSTTESLLSQVAGARGAARADEAGNVTEYSGAFDAETICAVAAMSVHTFDEIGALLGLGGTKGWSLVTEQRAMYVRRRPDELVVIEANPTKTPETVLKKLSQAT